MGNRGGWKRGRVILLSCPPQILSNPFPANPAGHGVWSARRFLGWGVFVWIGMNAPSHNRQGTSDLLERCSGVGERGILYGGNGKPR